MCPFEVGQRVVCVCGDWEDSWHLDEKNPVRGGVYTIRDISAHTRGIGLRFREIVNKPALHMEGGREVRDEIAFMWKCFKPVKETDISIFKAMLNPVKEDA